MKKRILLVLLGLLALLPAAAPATVAAPISLTAGTFTGSSLPISWADDETVGQWYIYVNGALVASPYPSQATLVSGTATRKYAIAPLAAATAPWVIGMTAYSGGQVSASSAYLTVSAMSRQAFAVSMTAGSSASGVTVVAGLPGMTITLTDWYMSSSAAAEMTLHHQNAAFYSMTGTSNVLDDQIFGVNGGDVHGGTLAPGLGQNQPICLDVSAAGTFTVGGHYTAQ
jgi:hypothetical protein